MGSRNNGLPSCLSLLIFFCLRMNALKVGLCNEMCYRFFAVKIHLIVCEQKFNQECNMSKHVKIVHEKSTQSKCDICNKTFTHLHNTRMHTKRVHGGLKNFECHFCKEKFKEGRILKRHVVNVHESK